MATILEQLSALDSDLTYDIRRIFALCLNLVDAYDVQLTANEEQLLSKYLVLLEMPIGKEKGR